jgi:hypothetical protein
MPRQNAIARRQSDALRLEVLRRYFDFSSGRPTAASIAREMDLPTDTVETWLGDPDNAQFLDEVVPLWPNLGRARDVASRYAEQMLQLCIDIANGHVERARAADRLKAAQFVLAIAGVRAAEQEERKIEEPKSNAIIVSVQVGGTPATEPLDVIDGQSRVVEEHGPN